MKARLFTHAKKLFAYAKRLFTHANKLFSYANRTFTPAKKLPRIIRGLFTSVDALSTPTALLFAHPLRFSVGLRVSKPFGDSGVGIRRGFITPPYGGQLRR
jgi:hypothetical protein